MIYRGENPIESIYRGEKVITAAYRGLVLVWELIKSCFGRGYWVGSAPYSATDAWKNYE